jgi:plastocyanin domain-containing protein
VYILTKGKSNSANSQQAKVEAPVDNVSYEGEKQIIEIGVKGGYTPQKSIAKAGIPTILKFKTNSTYDCSSSIRIPSLSISKNLPGTGITEVDIGTQPVGQLAGICGMGMYSFEIDFQS